MLNKYIIQSDSLKKEHFKKLAINSTISSTNYFQQFMLCINQLQFMLNLNDDDRVEFFNINGKLSYKDGVIDRYICDENDLLQYKRIFNLLNYMSYNKIERSISLELKDDLHNYFSSQKQPEMQIEDLFHKMLKNQDEIQQLLIKVYCYLYCYLMEFQNVLLSWGKFEETLFPIEVQIEQRAFLGYIYQTIESNLNLELKQKVDYEMQLNITHKLFLYNEQIENSLIQKAFELLDNNMYSFGRRKRSFEKEKETAYANCSQRGTFEALYPMDLHLAIFSQVAPPTTSPALTQVSNLSQYAQSLCLSPSNSDSQSFASFGPKKGKTFDLPYKQLIPGQLNFIDQNQYAQISQQSIDAQIRYRRFFTNSQQSSRVSRSKSNSALPHIFKQIELKEDKNEDKRRQTAKQSKTKNRKQQIQKQNK